MLIRRLNWLFRWVSLLALLTACTPPQAQSTPDHITVGTMKPFFTQVPNTPTIALLPSPTTEFIIPNLNLHNLTPDNIVSLQEIKMLGDGRLRASIVSPDGQWIAAGSTLGVRIHRANDLAEVGFLPISKPISQAMFSPDGSILAVASDDGFLRLFPFSPESENPIATVKPLQQIRAGYYPIQALAFSPDGKMLASGSMDRTISIWSLENGRRLRSLSGFGLGVSALAFSRDSTVIAGASLDGTIRVWLIRNGNLLASGGSADKKRYQPDQYSLMLVLLPEGWLISVDAEGTVTAWQWQTGNMEPINLIEGTINLNSTAFFPGTGQLLLSDFDGGISLYQIITGNLTSPDLEQINTFITEEDVIGVNLLAEENKILLAAYPATLQLLDLTNGTILKTYARTPLGSQVLDTAFSPDGNFLAVSYGDGLVRVWDTQNMQNYFELIVSPEETTRVLRFSSDGHQLICGADGIYIFSTAVFEGTLQKQLAENISPARVELLPERVISTRGSVVSLDITPDNHSLASINLLDQSVSIWDGIQGTLVYKLEGFRKPVLSLAFSPDGSLLAVGGEDHKIHVYDTRQLVEWSAGDPTSMIEPSLDISAEFTVLGIRYSSDGKRMIITGSYPYGRVVNTENGGLIFRLKDSKDQLVSAAFSPDGRIIATAGSDGTIRLYKDKGEDPILTLAGHFGMVNTLAFSPEGRMLISGGEDGTLRIWGIP